MKNLDARSALLRLAYLMHLAKKDEGSACGGDTYTFVISTAGGLASIDREEIKEAEELAKKMDSILISAILNVVGGPREYPAQAVSDAFSAIAEKYGQIDFPSLKMLETVVLPKQMRK